MGLDAEDDGFGVSDGKVLAGDAALAPATQGRIVDPNLAVMQLTTREEPFGVIATLVNFGSHPESLGSNNPLITSDFPHYVRERLEAEYGGLAIWLSGDLGVLQGPLDIDVLDPNTGAAATRRTFRFAEVHGTQLAERAIGAIDAVRLGPDGLPSPSRRRARPEDRLLERRPRGRAARQPVLPLLHRARRARHAARALHERRTRRLDRHAPAARGLPPGGRGRGPAHGGRGVADRQGRVRGGAGRARPADRLRLPRRARRGQTGAGHTFIAGLGNDEIGYQVPFAKWDNSCHACASFIILGVPQLCPLFPNIDCNTVFENNVGQQVDPAVTGALLEAIDGL